MRKPLLLAGLLALAMLAGLILALIGDGPWDLVAYVLIVPALILVAQISARAARGLRGPTNPRPRPSAKKT